MNEELENLQPGRDPLTPPLKESKSGLHQKFANWSKWLAIVSLGTFLVLVKVFRNLTPGDQVTRSLRVGALELLALMFLVSAVLGIMALCAICKVGSGGILKPALAGTIISLICLALFAYGFQHMLENKKAMAVLNEGVKKIRAETRMELTNNTLTASNRLEQLGSAERILGEASQNSSGDQSLTLKAMSGYMAKLKAQLARYSEAAEPIKNLARFDMSKVEKQEELQKRMGDVKTFMAASDSFLSFITNSDSILANECESLHLRQAAIEEVNKGFRETTAGKIELLAKLRLQDDVGGNAMLDALRLLDDNWGKWNYSTEKRTVLFEDHEVWMKYIACLRTIATARKEQTRLQQQLVSAEGK